MTTARRDGSRTVELYIPFDHDGSRVEEVTLGPFTLGHSKRWDAGEFANSFDFLVALCPAGAGVLDNLRYPDVDRVYQEFVALVPQRIREQFVEGVVPQVEVHRPAADEPLPTTFVPADSFEGHEGHVEEPRTPKPEDFGMDGAEDRLPLPSADSIAPRNSLGINLDG